MCNLDFRLRSYLIYRDIRFLIFFLFLILVDLFIIFKIINRELCNIYNYCKIWWKIVDGFIDDLYYC